ncbi:UNVERIFIED_CONTAM: Retrovirus-related Pol polyprotein from transposon gypsy [Sesamum indicum]
MWIDSTDLNKRCPKDPYPLPRVDLLEDSTARCAFLSMMDVYQGYQQILMDEEDRDKISFITESGIYCYNIILFRLKNAGATYQRLVNRMLKDLIGITMEVYVDDMLIKSREEEEHLNHLQATFEVMRRYGMKLNPSKCTFGVRGGKFQGYMVGEKGIETNSKIIGTIMNMSSPKTVKDVQKLTKCEQALSDLKQYLTTPPLLANPKSGKTLYLYLALFDDACAEKKYVQIEKLALALVTTTRKLRPYFQSHKIIPNASGRLVKELAREQERPRREEGWMLHVDGSSTLGTGGEGTLLQGPGSVGIEVATKLDSPTTNNEAEYEALTMGLKMAFDAGVKQLDIPREEKSRANALSKFEATIAGVREGKIIVVIKDKASIEEDEIVQCIAEAKSWKNEIEEYLMRGTKPDDSIAAERELRKLFKGQIIGTKSNKAMIFLANFDKDAMEFAKECDSCRKYATFTYSPATLMEPIRIVCPLDQWGIDILGPFPPAPAQKKFILVAWSIFPSGWRRKL